MSNVDSTLPPTDVQDDSDLAEAERIWEWVSATSDFVEDARTLEELASAKQRIEQEIRRRTFEPDGYIYVLRAGDYYKIGRAKNPDSRIRQLKIQLPFPVEVVYLFACEDYVAAEAYYHWLFASERVNGEWFLMEEHDLAPFRIQEGRGGILYRNGDAFGPMPVITGKLGAEA